MTTPSAGIFITQVGVSVPYAADYQYVFNSNWPSLQIIFESVVSVVAGGTITIPHNLGFYPAVMVWYSVNGVSVGRFYAETVFDKTDIYIYNLFGDDVVASIKCYNIDITIQRDYALPKQPLIKTKYDPTCGIKVAKYGKSLGSSDLRDFILHSRCQSPALLSVINQETVDPTDIYFPLSNVRYTNPANYTPWVLGYLEYATPNNSGDITKYKIYSPGGNQSRPAFIQIGKTSYLLPFGGSKGTLVVLRDPLVVPNKIQVTY